MSSLETLLADFNQGMADLVAATEKNGKASDLADIAQSLSDAVALLEKRKTEPFPMDQLLAAIKALPVPTVSPTPVEINVAAPTVNVTTPQPLVHVQQAPAQTFVIRVTKRDTYTNLFTEAEITIKKE